MSDNGTNARRFLDAHADIEAELVRQQGDQIINGKRATFWQRIDSSDELIPKHKEALKLFGNLRNAISHSRYLDGAPVADPRIDTVEEIERIRDLVLKPPRLKDALKAHGKPRIFSPGDDIKAFLRIVTDNDFSQAPVELQKGHYELITTNAVARWFAHNLNNLGGVVDSAPISHVLSYAENGDRLRKVGHDTTTVKAINIFSGQASSSEEPPAALLVMDLPGQPPQRLSVRADLALLYRQLGE